MSSKSDKFYMFVTTMYFVIKVFVITRVHKVKVGIRIDYLITRDHKIFKFFFNLNYDIRAR